MDYETISNANKKASLIISVRREKKWVESTKVRNDEWMYFLRKNSLETSTDGGISFHDAVEDIEIVLSKNEEKNICGITGCIYDHHFDDDKLLESANEQFDQLCNDICDSISGMSIDIDVYQYVKRQHNIQRVQLYNVLSDILTFTETTTGEITDSKLSEIKDFWIAEIKKHQEKSIKYLNTELQAADSEEITEEINKIISLVENVSVEAKEHLDELKDFNRVVQYWPNLLLPAPEFVVKI